MIYTKPELVSMVDARLAIQSQTDGGSDGTHEKEKTPVEMPSNFLAQSTAAYEADE